MERLCCAFHTAHPHDLLWPLSSKIFLHTKYLVFRIFERSGYVELWMLLWVRRIGRFRLSQGEVKNLRLEAGDGHMPLPSLWGLISQKGRDQRYIFMAPNVSVVETFQAGWSPSALIRTTSTEMISGDGGHIYDGSALHQAILRSAGHDLTVSSTKILSEYTDKLPNGNINVAPTRLPAERWMPRSRQRWRPIYAWIFLPSVSHWLAVPTAGRCLCFDD